MTRDTLIARVKARFGDANAEIYDADYYCNAVNEAYSACIASSPYWPFLETNTTSLSITAGANSVSLPTDAWRVLTLFNTTDKLPMREITGRRSYVDLYPDPTTITGTPIQYRLFNRTIFVYPTPTVTTAFSLDYPVRPARLTSGSSEPVIPDQYQDAIIMHAVATAHIDDGNLEQYAAHMEMYASRIQAMKEDLLGPRGDSYTQVSDAWESE